jgi:hypothetical protein
VGSEAALAVMQIAGPQQPGQAPLKGAEVAALVGRIAATAADGGVRNQAAAYLKANP